MSKSLFNRYVWLAETVYNSKSGITLEEINGRWVRTDMSGGNPIPQRTFHRYRREIEELFDVSIECRKSSNTYYIDNVDDIKDGGLRRWLLSTFAVNNLINESHRLKNRIQFEHIPSGQQYLTSIIEAMRDNRKVAVTYQSYWSEPATFELEPYFVKVFKQRWYVIGKSDRVRIYALDRIQHLEAATETFVLPDGFDPEAFFFNSYGIMADEDIPVERVVIRVAIDQARYIRALPLHHSQKETEATDHCAIFEYLIKPTYDFRQELLSHGADVEVVSPGWFRKEMKAVVLQMKNLYGTSNT
jgi:hypothetical protein